MFRLVFLLKAKYQTQFVEKPKFKTNPHAANASSSPENIYKNVDYYGKLTFSGDKEDKP